MEVRGARGQGAPRRGVFEPGLPAERVLGFQVRIAVRKRGGEGLIEARLPESRADGGDGPRPRREPDGAAGTIGGIAAEALVVFESRPEREARGALRRRDDLQIDGAVVPRLRRGKARALHRLPLERYPERDDVLLPEPRVDACVKPSPGGPVGARRGEGRVVARVVRRDRVLVVVAVPGGGEAAVQARRESVPEVEPDRRTARELMLVVAHDGAAIVGWEVVQGVTIAKRQGRLGTGVRPQPHAAAQDFVAVVVIEVVHAVA